MSGNVINYNISLDYLKDWGVQEALREIYQNFNDYKKVYSEEYEEKVISVPVPVSGALDDGESEYIDLILSNSFQPKDLSFLQIGNSSKRDDSRTVGCHGEGLKMAMLVLRRTYQCISIRTSDYLILPTTTDSDVTGKSFGITYYDYSDNKYNGFEVKLRIKREDYYKFKGKQVSVKDIIFHLEGIGSIIDKERGSVYVGGTYVCKMEKLNYAYNFEPSQVKLDRDRCVPIAFDVHYTASKILSKYKDVKVSDLTSPDASYMNSIPQAYMNIWEPEIINNKVSLIDRESNTVLPARLEEHALTNKKTKKAYIKLKYSVNRKTSPISLLKEFRDRYSYKFGSDASTDFEVLLQKAKNWVRRK